MKIISRTEWGAKPWRSGYSTRPMSAVSWFLVHYHGGPPPASTGVWVPRNIEAIHLGNGWSGVGYSFMVSQSGEIYEGRGWDKVGAHSPPHNTDGIGVYVAIGGDQEPTEAALRAVRWLYDEASRRAGRSLRKSWHGYDYATACPGPKLIAWVKAGMPTTSIGSSNTPTPQKDEIDMASTEELRKIVREEIARALSSDRITLSKSTSAEIGLKSITRDGLAQTVLRMTSQDRGTGTSTHKTVKDIAKEIDV